MNEAEEQLDRLLKTVIRDRLISDVPLGAFLSGGIDSSTVAAIMQTQNSQAIKTFSIGFSEAEYDEAPYAKKIAAHLGTDHTEVYLTPEACLEIIPQLPDIYDEPFADSSQIPTFLLSKVAKESVTVALSGDGGDELFAGYHRHIWAESLSRFQKFLPEEIRFSLGKLLLNPHFLQMLSWLNTRLLPGRLQLDQPELKFRKVGLLLSNKTWNKFYWQCLSSGTMADQLLLEPREIKTPFSHINNMDELLRADLSYYLPNDILTKVDRASMATSLEARVPLLDHRLVEFANQLDLKMKLQQGQSKFLLRQVLSHYVPKRLTNRPKMGFSLPLDHWLRTGLNSWANDLLSPQALEKSGFFNIPTIEKLWRSHCNHQKNHAHVLWNILMFQAWQNT